LRLGRYRDGYLIPYPDVTLLRLEADKFGNFRSGKYFLERVDVTEGMRQAFGLGLQRIFYCEGLGFAEYCHSFWKDVKVVDVEELPEPPKQLPRYYVTGTCKRCHKTYVMDTGAMLPLAVENKLKQTPFGQRSVQGSITLPIGECPAGGWHYESGTMWDNMTFDFSHVYQGGSKDVKRVQHTDRY
jgi:hypothetical protein